MRRQRDMMRHPDPQEFYYPDDQDYGYDSDQTVLQPRSREILRAIRHTLSLLTDLAFVVLGVSAVIWLIGHVTTAQTSATAPNTGNVVITTGNAQVTVSSSQNAPLALTGSATPLSISVTNSGTVPLKINASVTSTSDALSSALETSANFCINTTNCASATNTSFQGTWTSPLVLSPGQTGTLSIMLAVSPTTTENFGTGSQAVAVTVGGIQS